MKYKYIHALIAATAISCISATVEVDSACASKEMVLPGVPAEVSNLVGVQTVTHSLDEDLSDVLSKVTDIADAELHSVQLNFSGDVSFITYVKVTLQANNQADVLLANSVVSPKNNVVSVPIIVDNNLLLVRLKSGVVTLKVDVTGYIPVKETPLSSTLCVGVTAAASKSYL